MTHSRTTHTAAAGLLLAVAVFSMTVFAGSVPAYADDQEPLVGLVDAAAQRLQTADPVAAFKWNNPDSPISDPPRVAQVLASVSAAATSNHVDPDYVTAIFTDQINATEAIEYRRFSEWKLDPAAAPATAPDLSESRSAINALNQTMVTEVAREWAVLRSPGCAAELDSARTAVTSARQLDPMYSQALDFATGSYCLS
jgi:chorismate mutase